MAVELFCKYTNPKMFIKDQKEAYKLYEDGECDYINNFYNHPIHYLPKLMRKHSGTNEEYRSFIYSLVNYHKKIDVEYNFNAINEFFKKYTLLNYEAKDFVGNGGKIDPETMSIIRDLISFLFYLNGWVRTMELPTLKA